MTRTPIPLPQGGVDKYLKIQKDDNLQNYLLYQNHFSGICKDDPAGRLYNHYFIEIYSACKIAGAEGDFIYTLLLILVYKIRCELSGNIINL
jgi:hypothetical protein